MAHLSSGSPSKIIAVGLNYRSHAAELDMPVPKEPVIFLKPPSAVIGAGDTIVLPPDAGRIDYEAELAVIVGATARNLSRENAAGAVLGYACANDITARDLQARDGQWTRSKSFDTFCPLGPGVEVEPPPPEARVELFLNGERRQSSPLSDMIFPPLELVSFISGIMTLERGDVILTGTPPGVGALTAGDTVTVRIDGIGELVNSVR
ncbi:MAG: fumarylacetoacetate hydrolase family protein [Thermoleophilia bacterium]|nr:fumarylacetoacetate hydrolase family protein [Thermoleophilia bacterium]